VLPGDKEMGMGSNIGIIGTVDLAYLETLVAWLSQGQVTNGRCTVNLKTGCKKS
jgi:hypothetical protein